MTSPFSTSPRRPSWVDDERALESGVGPALPTELVLAEGTLLAGKYRLTRPAGFGGMAQLWVATNASTGAEVCVKVLVPESNGDEAVKRFRREAHAAARLSHRAIVRVFDLVELDASGEAAHGGGRASTAAEGGAPAALAIVMELLTGETLGDALMKRGKIPLEETLDVMIPVLSALAHAHRAGVVHRDIKPDNVFLAKDPDGHVTPKVLDFGISKLQGDKAQLTNDGVMLGTPSFMSPEQARGASKVDARSDVFSAAIVMVMMLSGRNPFEDESFHSVVSAILVREVERLPEVSDALWDVLEKALAKDPVSRFADATEFGIALRRAAGRQIVTLTDDELRPMLDSVVSVPPVTPGTTGEQSAAEPLEDEEVVGLPKKRSMMPLVAAAIAAVVAVVAVLGVRALGSGGRTSSVYVTGTGPATTSPVTTTVAAAAGEPREVPPPASAAPSSTVNAVASVSAAPAAPPRPKPASGATGTSVTKKPPKRDPSPGSGREPAIVRDPGF